MSDSRSKIIYTHTDEAPALATRSLLPIIRRFAEACGVEIETRDISLAGRILANFPDHLTAEQRVPDALCELGEVVKRPEAVVIKLPNISASIPQLESAIAELQARGFAVPAYPDEPANDAEREIKSRYDKVKGSAVNPVLREGNSDRRAPAAVKRYARSNPHSMGAWDASSKTEVASMSAGDFRHNEKSVTLPADDTLRIEHVDSAGKVTVLKEGIGASQGAVVDASFMSQRALTQFLREQIERARSEGVLFSLHMKATMMKVSDPIIFGHAVKAFFSDVFEKHRAALDKVGADPNNGLGNVFEAVATLPPQEREAIEADIRSTIDAGPALAMVDSDRGITNLHVPSDVIIDASMPAMIRASGQMWNADGQQQDTLAVIPESSYAALYQETIQFCKQHGAFDPTTMGTVPNVGLMAQKAEEYGSHDKTFEIESNGVVRVLNAAGDVLMEHQVEAGDIWRMCTVADAAIQDWVKLAVIRARATGAAAVFWLDETRPHDAELIKKVRQYLQSHDTEGLEIEILSVADATKFTLHRLKEGQDTISVSGNVLRDYLTDLFPILELGTSAKMLSIVPLMNGGGLFETGAGGSAPKHVQQFNAENHLRWDSLGEFLALTVAFEHVADRTGNQRAKLLADALDEATGKVLMNGKSPSRKVRELDNRGSHFYLALYWAEAMGQQTMDTPLGEEFRTLFEQLSSQEETIVSELNEVQGRPVDIGGYYFPDEALASSAMRPSASLNQLVP